MKNRLMATTVGITLCASMATIASAQSKQETHDGMLALLQQMRDLQPLVAKDPRAAALYAHLQAAYQAARLHSGAQGMHDDKLELNPQPAAGQTTYQPPVRPQGGVAGGGIAGAPGCLFDGEIVSGSPALAIADLSTVSDSHTFSGNDGVVWYVDLIVDITHTWAADLIVTLTSPAGTTVTLTSNNGGSNDDVFSSTFFRDNANPGGQVPYGTNDGLISDHVFVNATAASPLTPEQPLTAFYGENPNGVWTLTITDVAGGDVGTLNFWDTLVSTITQPSSQTTRTFVNPTDTAIPDSVVTSSNVAVANLGGFVCDVKVGVNITHTWNADLDITLTSPSGTVVTLTTDNGSSGDNGFAGTVFSDHAGVTRIYDTVFEDLVAENALLPEEPLDMLRGEPAEGTWTLRISDDAGGDTGTLTEWSLILTTCACEGCISDLNGDGFGDVNDLLLFLGGWGCP